MIRRQHLLACVAWTAMALTPSAWADNKAAAIDEMEGIWSSWITAAV